MNRYSARTSDRYSGGGSAATGSAATTAITTAITTAEGREQRVEGREQRVEVKNTSQLCMHRHLATARQGADAMRGAMR